MIFELAEKTLLKKPLRHVLIFKNEEEATQCWEMLIECFPSEFWYLSCYDGYLNAIEFKKE